MQKSFSVHHVVPCINQQIGGPAKSVPAIAEHLQSNEHPNHIWTNNYPELGLMKEGSFNLHDFSISKFGKILKGFNPSLEEQFKATLRAPAVIHSHGMWMTPNFYAARLARHKNLPLVISPRGMLSDWAKNYHSFRKTLAWHFFEKNNFFTAAGFHATSEDEAQSIARLETSKPITVIPNGIDSPGEFSPKDLATIKEKIHYHSDKKYLLFLSRIHAKKGILELLKAWKNLKQDYPGWKLIIAGPDLNNFLANALKESGISKDEPSVSFPGYLTTTECEALYSLSNLFILPTFSENFGIVIGEALLRSIPVITTNNSPWANVESINAGWLCDTTWQSVASTIKTALESPDNIRKEMGANGARYVSSTFNWQVLSDRMLTFYESLLLNQ